MENSIQSDQKASPRYSDILQEIGKQLARRKKALFLRTLLISWPLVLISGGVYMLNSITKTMSTEEVRQHFDTMLNGANPVTFCLILAFFILGVAFYYYFISLVVTIEKHLWLDSFFDQKNMDSKTSWKVAWKLFIPILSLTFQVALRYYVPPLLVLVLGFLGLSFAAAHTTIIGIFSNPMWWVLICIVLLCLVALYFYLLRVRLRFVFFLFLDRYNSISFAYSDLFSEMNKLNKISKSEGFKKALIINFGSDALRDIVLFAIGAIQAGMNLLGTAGGFVGSLLRPIAEEGTRQVTSFARLTAIYLLYQQARTLLYNEPQQTNEYIDSLR